MNVIPLSQFDANKFPEFDSCRLFQCSDIQSLESEVETTKRGLIEETVQRNKVSKEFAKVVAFGPVVFGEATAVTDHIDVFQYYQLVEKKG